MMVIGLEMLQLGPWWTKILVIQPSSISICKATAVYWEPVVRRTTRYVVFSHVYSI